MIAFSFISLFSFFVCLFVGFFVGFFVYFQSGKKSVHLLFFLLCVFNALYGLCEFLYRQAGDADMAYFWAKSTLPSIFVVGLAIHFIIEFFGKTEVSQNWWFRSIIYGPLVILAIFGITTDWIFSGVDKAAWGYQTTPGKSVLARNFYNIWLMSMGQLSILVSFIIYIRLKPGIKKKNAKYITLGCISPSILALLTIGLLPAVEINIPQLLSLGTALQGLLFGYAIWKYDMFDLNPTTAANNIVSTMSDLLILIDPHKHILYVNKSALDTTGYTSVDLITQNVSIIFSHMEMWNLFEKKEIFGEIHSDDESRIKSDIRNLEGVLVAKNGDRIPINTSISTLTEKDGSVAGYVLVARDVAEREKMIHELRDALEKIKTLRGLLPICARCKKVRDDKGYWKQIETYIEERSDAQFTHGICDDCAHELYKDAKWYQRKRDTP